MITGTARPARPSRNSGVKKDISIQSRSAHRQLYSANPCQPLAGTQIREQRVVERCRSVCQEVVDAITRKTLLESVDVGPDQGSILLGERVGHHRYLHAG